MPVLTEPALAKGALRAHEQPHLPIDDRTTLRPWRTEDAQAVRAAFDCPHIQRWHVRRMDSLDEAQAWIGSWLLRWRNETDASWAIVDTDDQPLGQVGLRTIDLVESAARISYWVLPEARGHGTAAKAVRAMSTWAFETLGLHRLCADHSTSNPASCRVAETAGLTSEGTLRGSALHTDGWHDMHLHSRLRTDC